MKNKTIYITDNCNRTKYENFLEYAFSKCNAFMLVYVNYYGKGLSREKKDFKNALKAFVLKKRSNPSWPGVPYTYCPKTQYSIVFYQTDPKAKEILKAKSCLSEWSGPHAPEDLAFFIDDVCWFFSVGHESIACFPHPDNEDKLFVEENGLFLFDSNEEYYDDFDEKGLAKLIDKKLDK